MLLGRSHPTVSSSGSAQSFLPFQGRLRASVECCVEGLFKRLIANQAAAGVCSRRSRAVIGRSIIAELPEPHAPAVQPLQPAVDRLRRRAGGVGPAENASTSTARYLQSRPRVMSSTSGDVGGVSHSELICAKPCEVLVDEVRVPGLTRIGVDRLLAFVAPNASDAQLVHESLHCATGDTVTSRRSRSQGFRIPRMRPCQPSGPARWVFTVHPTALSLTQYARGRSRSSRGCVLRRPMRLSLLRNRFSGNAGEIHSPFTQLGFGVLRHGVRSPKSKGCDIGPQSDPAFAVCAAGPSPDSPWEVRVQ